MRITYQWRGIELSEHSLGLIMNVYGKLSLTIKKRKKIIIYSEKDDKIFIKITKGTKSGRYNRTKNNRKQ